MADGSAITERNIGKVEKETMKIASGTLSALESALAAWDASKEKPEELAQKFRIVRHERVHRLAGTFQAAMQAVPRRPSP